MEYPGSTHISLPVSFFTFAAKFLRSIDYVQQLAIPFFSFLLKPFPPFPVRFCLNPMETSHDLHINKTKDEFSVLFLASWQCWRQLLTPAPSCASSLCPQIYGLLFLSFDSPRSPLSRTSFLEAPSAHTSAIFVPCRSH